MALDLVPLAVGISKGSPPSHHRSALAYDTVHGVISPISGPPDAGAERALKCSRAGGPTWQAAAGMAVPRPGLRSAAPRDPAHVGVP